MKSCPDAGQGGLGEVEFARRNSAGDEQKVSRCSLGQRFVEGLGVVGGGGQNPGFAARGAHEGGQHRRVGVANLAGSRRGRDGDKLVASGENSHVGPAKDLQSGIAAGRGQSDLPGVERASGGKQLLSHARLDALSHNVLAPLQGTGREQPDRSRPFSACCLNVFEHRHGIGPRGNRRSGHDLPSGSGQQRTGWRIAGSGSAGDRQRIMPVGLDGAAGIAVAGGAGEGRLVAIGPERLGEDAARHLPQPHALDSGPEPAQSRGMSGHQRRGLPVAGQSGSHGMDCSVLSRKFIKNACHPERSLARTLRQTESKDLRLRLQTSATNF